MKPLKLFHATDFVASMLQPGENRQALHPRWLPALAGAWAGLACNPALWRALAAPSPGALGPALALAAILCGGAVATLAVFGWRPTRKAAAACVVLLAAWAGTVGWLQPGSFMPGSMPPVKAWLLGAGDGGVGLATWGLLAAQALPALAVLWRLRLRRLDPSEQLAANFRTLGVGLGLLALAALLLRA